ncbi:hypothetical protein AOQ84DRAFT_354956 [Glonium stellatum]|uniref:Uncharacterized protein n=1 Tax=Glonium stellatum TaxID=574774 RepID=A0A8E2JSF1_9PEZI|nr:hypothetical protein AOQ84DRAFT_354956 [Glonium stellatum]
MSVTTTQNAATYSTLPTLADYELHHSETPNPAPAPNSQPAPTVRNPPEWLTDYRRVPNYRPINRDLDQSQRRVYNNFGERAFINVMFAGLWLDVSLAKLWRATGGRFNDKIFRYKVGGEW